MTVIKLISLLTRRYENVVVVLVCECVLFFSIFRILIKYLERFLIFVIEILSYKLFLTFRRNF